MFRSSKLWVFHFNFQACFTFCFVQFCGFWLMHAISLPFQSKTSNFAAIEILNYSALSIFAKFLWIYCFYNFVFSKTSYSWKRAICCPSILTVFSQQCVFKVLPCPLGTQWLLSYQCTVLCCMNVPELIYQCFTIKLGWLWSINENILSSILSLKSFMMLHISRISKWSQIFMYYKSKYFYRC